MESTAGDPPPPSFPERMFVMGEEPMGIRVTPYHKPSCISKIINALVEEEVNFIRGSAFGKLLEIADKPSFSGRVGRFLFSRLLKIRKKHEVWFLFAGKPIRFSMREFALVTGLNCRPYPPNTKKRSKKFLSETPYWGELFGTLTEVPVNSVVSMLKNKTVTDRGIRIKYALLALLSAVVIPTSHRPRILHAAAEKIRDLNKFLDYPWGRVSFDMLMSSIKERDEVSLSQNTIAFKGFVMAIQLVLIEAVPSLLGVVREGDSSGSEADSEDEEESAVVDREGKKSINTGLIRSIDSAGKVRVVSIISDGAELPNWEPDARCEDEEDVLVDNMVRAVGEAYEFSNSNFKGGATKSDVCRMRDEAIKANKNRKEATARQKQPVTEGIDAEYVASIVTNRVSADLSNMDDKIKDLALSLRNSQEEFHKKMEDLMRKSLKEITDSITNPCTRPQVQQPEQTEQDNTEKESRPGGQTSSFVASDIIEEAIRFADKETTHTCEASNEAVMTDVVAHGFHGGGDDQETVLDRDFAEKDIVEPALPPTINTAERSTVPPHDLEKANQETFGSGLSFPDPSFSIGLTQLNNENAQTVDHVPHENNDESLQVGDIDEEGPILNRKSKRTKVVPRNLVDDYQCDRGIIARAWESYVNAICSTPNIDYAAKFSKLLELLGGSKVVIDIGGATLKSSDISAIVDRSSHLTPKMLDVLIQHTRSVFLANSDHMHSKNSVFLDTKFLSLLTKSFSKFSKAVKKDKVRFPAALCSLLVGDCPITEVSRIYFPFNFDKQHWVGVCVDVSLSQVIVLDCNTSLKTDTTVASDLRPITQMFPYILKQAGRQLTAKEMKPFTLDRPRAVPQNRNLFESGVTTVMLIQAHSFGGVDVCKCITPEVLDTEVQRIAVMMYEDNVAPL